MTSRPESPAVPVTTFANLVMFAILLAAGWHFMNLETAPKTKEARSEVGDGDEFAKTDSEVRAMLWKSGSSSVERNLAIESWARMGTSAVPTLEAGLEVPDPVIRRSSATALALMGAEARDAAPALRQLLQDPDDDVRHAGVAALLAIGADLQRSIPDFVRLVREPHVPVRNAATKCLTATGPICVPHVLPLARAVEPEVRFQAAVILDKIGYGDARAEQMLRNLLDDRDSNVRREAFRALLEWESLTQAEIAAALDDSDSGLVHLAVQALEELGCEGGFAVPRLRELLQTSDPTMHEQILATCAAIGPSAGFAIPVLHARAVEPTSTSGEFRQRCRAVEMLGRIGAGAPIVEETLFKLLDDPHSAVVRRAGRALRHYGPQAAERAAMLLLGRLDAPDYAVRLSALAGLQGLGPAAASAIPILTERLPAASADEAVEIAAALGEMGPIAAESVARILDLLQERALLRGHGREVVRALGQIGACPEAVVPMLSDLICESTPFLKSYEDEFRMHQAGRLVFEAARALAQFGPAAAPAMPVLLTLLDEDVVGYDDARVREHVLDLLPGIAGGVPEAELAVIETALELLYDENPHMRAMAAEVLGALKPHRSPDVIAELMSALNDPSPYVRTAAALALGRQGKAARSAAPALEELLRERHNAWRNRHTPPSSEIEDWTLGLYQSWSQISVHDAASRALQAIDPQLAPTVVVTR